MPRYLEDDEQDERGVRAWFRNRTLGVAGLAIAVAAIGAGSYLWIAAGAKTYSRETQLREFLQSRPGGSAPAEFVRKLDIRGCDPSGEATPTADPVTACSVVSQQRDYVVCISTDLTSGRLVSGGAALPRGIDGCEPVAYDPRLRDLRIVQ